MVTEIATITIAAGREGEFDAAMQGGGLDALRACAGVQSVRFGRGVESPDTFAFVVEWDSMEAHETARADEAFTRFRAAFGTCATGGAMAHYTLA